MMPRYAALLLLVAGCAGMPDSTKMLPVMGYADSQGEKKAPVPADSQAVALARTGAPGSPAAAKADTALADSTSALAQKVLLLPFKDLSKYRGPWDICAELPRSLADSLARNAFIRPMAPDSVFLAGLKGKERKGLIDWDRALELGRQAGVDLVVMGEIEDLSMKRFRATVPIGGYRSYQGVTTIKLRVLKVVDGRPAGEPRQEAVNDSKRYGVTNPAANVPLDREYFFLGETPWGTEAFQQTLVGGAVTQCLGKLSADLANLVQPPALPSSVSAPKIIDIDGLQVYINIGLADSLQNGDKFGVWDHGHELRDPQTNAVLGFSLPRRVGVVQIEQVLNEHLSIGRVLEAQGQIEKEFTIRAE
ncbi:MAG: hypothetical protein IT369_08835 [Candidatus Latescibacteria bacterium]|nr:hypothetical protein [Candidatus Latescibacterota bacterium]